MWRQSQKASTMPSSKHNMQILQKKRTFSQGMHEQKSKTAAWNCGQPQLWGKRHTPTTQWLGRICCQQFHLRRRQILWHRSHHSNLRLCFCWECLTQSRCKQAQDLGIITVNVNDLNWTQNQSFNKTSKTALTKLVDSQGTRTTSNVLTTLIQLSTHHEQYQSTTYHTTKLIWIRWFKIHHQRVPTWTTRLLELQWWNFRYALVLEDGLTLKSDRILIPKQLRRQVLDVIHLAHRGEMKCIFLAREAVFWPGINNDIREMVKGCDTCNKHRPAQAKLPILQPELPTRLWEKVGTDLFEFNSSKYLMRVDYFSRFPVIRLISNMTANTICSHFTQILSEYGLPSHIHGDFGT